MQIYYFLHIFIFCKTVVKTEFIPEYIKQCKSNDPNITECIISLLENLKPYLRHGISEIELPSVEPFKMDNLFLQLTEGIQGYKIVLQNMYIFGSSNFEIQSLSISTTSELFKVLLHMPKLKIKSKYASSGVLLIIPASGGGDFEAILSGVKCNFFGRVSTYQRNNTNYLHMDSLNTTLSVTKTEMRISNAFQNNRILLEATNLFLRENGQLVLEIMQAQLQEKLSKEFLTLANQLLKHIPKSWFYE